MTDAPVRSAANEKLFHALSFAELPGVPSTVKEIEPAIAAGADLHGILEEGCTPLTYAIQSGMGSPKSVKVLLELGANPSQRDANGWTPWALCIDKMETPCVADRMEKITDLLSEYRADRSDERVLLMKKAMIERNQEGLLQLFAEGIDINSSMICPLYHAVIQHEAEMVRFLLKQGADPEGNDPQHTCLMSAVQHNQPNIIKILLEAGADPTRLWGGLPGFTLVALAKDNGHKELGSVDVLS